MLRKFTGKLLQWKDSDARKPLLLQGARQTGKTYCLEEFGKNHFANCYLFDFMETPSLGLLFDQDLNPERIIRDLGLLIDTDIDMDKSLVIFDEIQECPNALTSLKYFAQKLPKAFIAASGSLLGLGLSDGSFPVGKVTRHKLYPLDFDEFLLAMGKDRLGTLINSTNSEGGISEAIHQQIWALFKFYMITGGLPEVVKVFREKFDTLSEAFRAVREIQTRLVNDYMDDISKHSGKIKAVRIQAVLKNIPIQLARETNGTKKFIFKDVLPNGSRYSLLEGPIEWLVKAGLVFKVPICNNAELPLQAYADEKRFKLYIFDVGILGCMLELLPKTIFSYDYGSYKGYFAENVVLMEMMSRWNKAVYSWSRNTSEIEFLMDYDGAITPIEVKAGINTKAKSLKVFRERYLPEQAVLLSGRAMLPMKNGMTQLPLYMAGKYPLKCK